MNAKVSVYFAIFLSGTSVKDEEVAWEDMFIKLSPTCLEFYRDETRASLLSYINLRRDLVVSLEVSNARDPLFNQDALLIKRPSEGNNSEIYIRFDDANERKIWYSAILLSLDSLDDFSIPNDAVNASDNQLIANELVAKPLVLVSSNVSLQSRELYNDPASEERVGNSNTSSLENLRAINHTDLARESKQSSQALQAASTSVDFPIHSSESYKHSSASSEYSTNRSGSRHTQKLIQLGEPLVKSVVSFSEEKILQGQSSHDGLNNNNDANSISQTKALEKLDEIKVRFMYDMVHCVALTRAEGYKTSHRVMYLTNKQTNVLLSDSNSMIKCIDALITNTPELVIFLSASMGMSSINRLNRDLYGTSLENYLFYDFTLMKSEIDIKDERKVMDKIEILMKYVILPIALKRKALIVVHGTNNCVLNTSLSKVVIAEQARYGNECPFQVIAFVLESDVERKVVINSDSVAHQLSLRCPDWKRNAKSNLEFYNRCEVSKDKDVLGIVSSSTKRSWDVTDCASVYIVFDCLDKESEYSYNENPFIQFYSKFMSYFTQSLNTVAFQTLGVSEASGWSTLEKFVLNGNHLILLDARERCFSCNRLCATDSATKHYLSTESSICSSNIQDLLKEFSINAKDCETCLAKATNAFPAISDDKLLNSILEVDSEGFMTSTGSRQLLTIAKECYTFAVDKVFVPNGIVDVYDGSLLAYVHSALKRASSCNGTLEPHSLEESIRLQLNDKKKGANRKILHNELVSYAANFFENITYKQYFEAHIARVKHYLSESNSNNETQMVSDAKIWLAYCEAVRNLLNSDDPTPPFDFPEYRHPVSFKHTIHNILGSPRTHSCSIFDLDGVEAVVDDIVSSGQLPKTNSLSALNSLKVASEDCKLYAKFSIIFKVVTKFSYLLLLIIGVLIVLVSVMEGALLISSRTAVIVLSFCGTSLAVFVGYVAPAEKWEHLRAAELKLLSEVWMFSTRTGDYGCQSVSYSPTALNHADETFASKIVEIRQILFESTDLKNFAFYAHANDRTIASASSSKWPGDATNAVKHQVTRHASDSSTKIYPSEDHASAAKDLAPLLPSPRSRNALYCIEDSADDDVEKPKSSHPPAAADVDADQDESKPLRVVEIKKKEVIKVPLSLVLKKLMSKQSIRPTKFEIYRQGAEDAEEGFSAPKTFVNTIKYWGSKCLNNIHQSLVGEFPPKVVIPWQPLSISCYIRLRLEVLIEKFKARIPKIARRRYCFQIAIVMALISSGLLAFGDAATWASLSTIIGASAAAFLEFDGTRKKVASYSSFVVGLQHLKDEYLRKDESQRMKPDCINEFITKCERLIMLHYEKWRPTSQLAKILDKNSSELSQ